MVATVDIYVVVVVAFWLCVLGFSLGFLYGRWLYKREGQGMLSDIVEKMDVSLKDIAPWPKVKTYTIVDYNKDGKPIYGIRDVK